MPMLSAGSPEASSRRSRHCGGLRRTAFLHESGRQWTHYPDDEDEYDEDILEFDPHFDHDAKMEIKLNEQGVNFVGNVEGYLALARMFTFLAQAHLYVRMEENPSPDVNTSYGYGPYHMKYFIRDAFIQNKHYLFTSDALQNIDPEYEQELFFWLSDQIGPEFWVEKMKTSNDLNRGTVSLNKCV
nr:hypothetical protein [Exiguobacterium mexicanum]